MSNLTNPETVIRAALAGSAIYARTSIDGAPMRTVLLIREDDARINALGSAPAICGAGYSERKEISRSRSMFALACRA